MKARDRTAMALPLLGALLSSGCTPTYNAISGPLYTSERLALDATHAEAQCRALRADRRQPPHPFTTDGCTLWPDGGWQTCCVQHDMLYWCGGGGADRLAADRLLESCVAELGHATLAAFMFLGVRLAGHPYLPFPWRWGFGWDWPSEYP